MPICTCSRCAKFTCFDVTTGRSSQGQNLSSRNKLKHHLADFQATDPQDIIQDKSLNIEGSQGIQNTDRLTEEYGILDAEFEKYHLNEKCSQVTVVALVLGFLGWLHLYCQLSHAKCQLARQFILKILAVAQDFPLLSKFDHDKIPKDIRTTLSRLSIKIELFEQICCPKCFSLYVTTETPWICQYKKSSRARECGEELFTLKSSFRAIKEKGKSQKDPSLLSSLPSTEIGVPQSVYTTQKLSIWLEWFLSKPGIESNIASWHAELNRFKSSKMSDIQQSPAWLDVTWPPSPETHLDSDSLSPPSLNLIFSIFIDWFNPQGNKQKGRIQSMGVLSFNCLNLPQAQRNSLMNTCIAGIIPGPNAPDVWMVSRLFEGLIDDLQVLETGVKMATNEFPNGRLVRVKLIPLLGDVVGMHKVAGYASHLAKRYCAWCWGASEDMAKMVISQMRTKEEVIQDSKRSKDALTLARKDAILGETGIRWSEFNRLTYRDPVHDLPLGIMHNWFEGVLQQHFRWRWGFAKFSTQQKSNKRRSKRDDTNRRRKRPTNKSSSIISFEDSNSEIPGSENDIPELNNSEGDGFELGGGEFGGLFNEELVELFQEKMRDVVLPRGIARLPLNLGESKHGKLKAVQWHSLFSYFIPLIIIELFVSDVNDLPPESNRSKILLNTGYLCKCTNIVCAKEVSNEDSEQFEVFYKKYTETSKSVFNNPEIRPNHHYALHIPQQIRRWGPLNQVAEFSGERLIGVLQKIQTNGLTGEMGKTILCRFTQLQRLPIDSDLLSEKQGAVEDNGIERIRNMIELEDDEYEKLLAYVQLTLPKTRPHSDHPHPKKSLVLRAYVTPKGSYRISENVLVSVLKPNHCIKYKKNDRTFYGFVRKILEFKNPYGRPETVFMVNSIKNLYPKDLESHSKWFRYILFLFKCVLGEVQEGIVCVSPKDVQNVAAHRLLTAGAFGIGEGGVILRPYDYTTQLEI